MSQMIIFFIASGLFAQFASTLVLWHHCCLRRVWSVYRPPKMVRASQLTPCALDQPKNLLHHHNLLNRQFNPTSAGARPQFTMRLSAATLLVSTLGWISAATAHTIQLKAHSRECFHETLHRDDLMTVSFQVGDREFGGSGNLEIDFWVG